MTSGKQIAANRRNAAKSTGPKSKAGKNIVSLNALKHGLQAEHVVIPGEDAEAFEALLDGLKGDWQPVGTREGLLVERIACWTWRLRRLGITETAMMHKERLALERARATKRQEKEIGHTKLELLSPEELGTLRDLLNKAVSEEVEKNHDDSGSKITPFRPSADQFSIDEIEDEELSVGVVYRRLAKDREMLSRYEPSIVRRLRDAEQDLERVQAARKAEIAPTANVIDITDLNEGKG